MNQEIPLITTEEAIKKLHHLSDGRRYWLMYSSLYKAFVKQPEAMVIPIDDHMVHRGDGIFEALRFHNRRIFDLEGHLVRLQRSAEAISLDMPWSRSEIEYLCYEIVRRSPESDGMLRIFVSRGYGDFSANPYSTQGSHIYLVTMPIKYLPKEKYERGASVIFSTIPVKPGFFSQVKSCNYLPNVLMKKEAVDRGVDFAVNLTLEGYVCEGPTENIVMLSSRGELIAPQFDYTLRGTTLLRVMELAREHAAQLGIRDVGTASMTKTDFFEAQEVMMIGTTLGVLPVTSIDGRPVNGGVVGPVARALGEYLSHKLHY